MTTTMAGIIKRGERWHFRWVVPEEYREVAGKNEIHKSLKTDSKAEALARAADYERELRARFEAALAGKNPVAEGMERFTAAVRIAQGLGMSYKSAKDLAAGRVEDILARVEAARDVSPDGSNAGAVAAVLGGVEAPGLRLSELADHVEKISTNDNLFKNPTQMRKWRGGVKRSIAQTALLQKSFSRRASPFPR